MKNDATLILINPYAFSGRSEQVWQTIKPALETHFGEIIPILTHDIAQLMSHLESAAAQGIRRILSIGGDGTNYSLVNTLVAFHEAHPEHRFILGSIPAGTGRDWVRGMGVPLNPLTAVEHLAQAAPRWVDLGYVVLDGQGRYFLNISSAGISYDVVERIESHQPRRPWTFVQSIVESIMNYEPEPIQIWLDGQLWYEGTIYVVAIANGTTFGQGMQIAPHALIDDGLFDVIIVEGTTRLDLLTALHRVYRATHLSHPRVQRGIAQSVEVRNPTKSVLGIELDGENIRATELQYQVKRHMLEMLF